MTTSYLGTSTGLRRRFDQPAGRLEINGKSVDFARSAWSGAHTRTFADIDVDALADDLETRLGWATDRIDLPAGRYETILPPTAVADLMIYAYWTASARDAEEGRNVYAAGDGATRVGERLAALPLTLRSDPSEPGLQCAPFEIATQSYGGLQSVFDNGARVGPIDWMSDGTLRNLVRTRAWAAKTATAPRALCIEPDARSRRRSRVSSADMIANTERGLLLTCLWYIREVDPQTLLLTGLTRDGVYLVENGKVARCGEQLPVQRIAGGLVEAGHRSQHDHAHAFARMERLFPAHRDAGIADSGLQHVHGEPGPMTDATATTRICRRGKQLRDGCIAPRSPRYTAA